MKTKLKSNLMRLISAVESKSGSARKSLMLSFVALVLIVAIMVVSTSAWVETISMINISTDKAGKIGSAISTVANIDADSKDTINLSKYFDPSGDVHLASASSSDGKNIFFPEISNDSSKTFRKGTINDINVNYISFSVKVNVSKSTRFFFNGKPTIKVGGTTISDSSVRVAVSKNSSAAQIYAPAASTDNAVVSVEGKTAATDVWAYDKSVGTTDDKEPVFIINQDEGSAIITFTLWLEDPNVTASFAGKDVSISDFELITAEQQYTLTFVDRTTGYNDQNSSTSNGLYWVKNSSAHLWVYDATSKTCLEMTQSSSDTSIWTTKITETFVTNKNGNLYFLRTSSSTAPTPTSGYTDKWTTKLADDTSGRMKYTAYSNVVDNTGDKKGTWGNVVEIQLDTEDTDSLSKPTSASDDYLATHVTFTANSVSYEMNFKTVDSVNVWRAYIPDTEIETADTNNSGNGDITFSFPSGSSTKTYNAVTRNGSLKYVITSSSTGYWDPPSNVAVSCDTSMGTVAVTGGKSTTSVKVTKGTVVTLSATPKSSSYAFIGWFTNASLTSGADSLLKNSTSSNGTYTAQYTATADNITFYAKFEKQYRVQLTAVTGTSSKDSTGGTVQFNTDTATNYVSKYVLESNKTNNGSGYTFTAANKNDDGYDFVGWYSAATGGTLVSGNKAYTVSSINSDLDLYARYKLREFTVTAVATKTGDFTGNNVTFSEPTGANTGTEVSVTVSFGNYATYKAVPADSQGYEFVGWYEDEACTDKQVSTASSYRVKIVDDTTKTLYAKFKLQEFTVTAYAVSGTTSNSSTGGTVTVGSGSTGATSKDTITWGTSVTLTATVKSGYTFAGWYTNSGCTTAVASSVLANSGKYTDATITVSSVKAAATYYASFKKNPVVTAYAVTGGSVDTSLTGGTVKVNSSSASYQSSATVTYNSSVTFTAAVNSGYKFDGWYTAATGGSLIDSSASFSKNITAETYNAYARFTKSELTTTIYFEPRSGFSTYSVYIYSDAGASYSNSWPGDTATYDSNTGYYKISFTTSDSGSFRFIVSNNGSSQYPASNQSGIEGEIGNTYLLTSGNTLKDFDPNEKVTITFDASSTTWVSDASAVMYLYDKTTGKSYKMTNSSNKWTVSVHPNVTNIEFYRCTPAGFGTSNVSSASSAGYWNKWSAGSRGTKTTYKTSSDGVGSWQ
jgi:uncharacterized repeat protein (TIGR02543 family)